MLVGQGQLSLVLYSWSVGSHLIRALIAATVRTLHCVAPDHANLFPHNNPGRGFLGLFYNKTTAAQ